MKFNLNYFKNGNLAMHCKNKKECDDFLNCLKMLDVEHNIEDYILDIIYNYNAYFIYDTETKEVLPCKIETIRDNKCIVLECNSSASYSELKYGMVVKDRENRMYLVTKDIDDNLFFMNSHLWDELCNFNEDLTNKEFSNLDIIEIYVPKSKKFSFNNLFNLENLDLVWKRKEPKKMTLKEISEALGYDVEVVDE